MSLKKIVSSTMVAAVAAGSLIPLSTAASAGDHGRGYRDNGPRIERYESRGGGDFRRNDGPRRDWGHQGGHDRYAYKRHRDHTGRNVALGVFAAILGLAIASEAGNASHYNDYRD